jgi:cardiolipin synthase
MKMRRQPRWIPGNRFELLVNGEAFYPRVNEAIEAAEREVLIQTFILFEDAVGKPLRDALVAAAQRGVRVDLLIDGFGSPDLSPAYIEGLTSAGVRVHVFDPGPRLFGLRTNMFRRMHRKLVVVDGRLAFVGGINYSADHLKDYGPEAKQDYAVACHGPIVGVIDRFAHDSLEPQQRMAWLHRRERPALDALPPPAGDADALFVTRDNAEHRNDIERHYRIAIRAARRRVVIANAYFFPGYRLRREMRRAARRGVDVRLILQGMPDMPIVKFAASMLYHHLVMAGVRIYEYVERPLHGKVALTDEQWSTVGSSNLDPLSLSLNLEANVMIRDRAFNALLHDHLDELVRTHCRPVRAEDLVESTLWRRIRSYFVFHLLRWYPRWGGWLPAHRPRVLQMPAAAGGEGGVTRVTEQESA